MVVMLHMKSQIINLFIHIVRDLYNELTLITHINRTEGWFHFLPSSKTGTIFVGGRRGGASGKWIIDPQQGIAIWPASMRGGCQNQWQIQDYPRRGCQLPRGAPTYDFAKISQNCMKLKEFGPPVFKMNTFIEMFQGNFSYSRRF